MVVFKYKATPVSVNGSTTLGSEQEEGSDQDDEQGKVILLKSWGTIYFILKYRYVGPWARSDWSKTHVLSEYKT